MKVAIIGTVGVPANYGGFETFVDQLVQHNGSPDIQYTVYCSSKAYTEKLDGYRGAAIRYVGLKANGIQSIPYDIVSLVRATRGHDVVLILGVSGCSFLPIYRLFSRKRLIINIDGLEHRRDKWSPWIRRFLRFSERMAVRYGNEIVTDNQGITDYVTQQYGKPSNLIAYGGDHVLQDITDAEQQEILSSLGLASGGYDLAMCRIEPENNVHVILEAYSQLNDRKLVFIGNWDRNEYSRSLLARYGDNPNIVLRQAVYDLRYLHALRSHCAVYLHGHSAGGTNPSLVEAMFFGCPVVAFDCVYNRESTEGKAFYFDSAASLASTVGHLDPDKAVANARAMQDTARRRYTWDTVSRQYESLYSEK